MSDEDIAASIARFEAYREDLFLALQHKGLDARELREVVSLGVGINSVGRMGDLRDPTYRLIELQNALLMQIILRLPAPEAKP